MDIEGNVAHLSPAEQAALGQDISSNGTLPLDQLDPLRLLQHIDTKQRRLRWLRSDVEERALPPHGQGEMRCQEMDVRQNVPLLMAMARQLLEHESQAPREVPHNTPSHDPR